MFHNQNSEFHTRFKEIFDARRSDTEHELMTFQTGSKLTVLLDIHDKEQKGRDEVPGFKLGIAEAKEHFALNGSAIQFYPGTRLTVKIYPR